MKNKTIEERAKKMCYFMNGDLRLRDVNIEEALIIIVTEQDNIARNDERERCIKAAQKLWCKNHCYDYNRCIYGLGNTRILREECVQKARIRKAIEEGGEE